MKKKKAHAAGQGPNLSVTNPPRTFFEDTLALFNSRRFDLLDQKINGAVHKWPNHAVVWKAIGVIMLMEGRFKEAIEPLTTAANLAQGDAQLHHNLGVAYLRLEQYEKAVPWLQRATSLKPDYAQAFANLGIAQAEIGLLQAAESSYRTALKITKDFPEALNNLGNVLNDQKRYGEAEECFRRALVLKPDFAEALNNLGTSLKGLNRLEEAEATYRKALSLMPDYTRAHIGLGHTLLKLRQPDKAAASFRRAIELSPYELEAHDGLSMTLGDTVPLWHLPMMNDKPRNDAYFNALQAAVTPETRVLEIGTGSGLLSMMSAHLGARHVTTCEVVTAIAETAASIVKDNGFADQVTVIPKLSTTLEVGVDLEERADLLVSEILSSEFLGEGVLSSIEDAKRRLLKPGARIIPARGSVRIALFGGRDIEMNVRVDEVYGFDLSRFNDIVPPKQYVGRNDLNIELLSDGIGAIHFDFMGTDHFPASRSYGIDVPITRAGRCCGVIQWIRLEMDDTFVFENHPAERNVASGWQHCVYLFKTPIDVQPGQVAQIIASHDIRTCWFFLKKIVTP